MLTIRFHLWKSGYWNASGRSWDATGTTGASKFPPPPDPNAPPPALQETTQTLITVMGLSIAQQRKELSQFAEVVADSTRRDGNQCYRALKPKKDITKVTASDARTLMSELAQFGIDLGELGLPIHSEAGYR